MTLRALLGTMVLLVFAACGPVGGDEDDDNPNKPQVDAGLDVSLPQLDAGPGVEAGPPTDLCSDEAKLVYVVDENGMFSSFDPHPTPPVFTDLGKLTSCPVSSTESPYSMSVDRDAIAWVLSNSGNLYRVDIKNALACQKTAFNATTAGMPLFGMGFVTNAVGGTEDTLYVAGGADPGSTTSTATLGTVKIPDLTLQTILPVTGWPELTGNGNAELWGFYPDETAPKVARINKQTAVEDPIYPLPSLAGTPRSWAFAFWGGDFWVFLARGTLDPKTAVYRVKGTDGTLTTAIENTGRRIVGAGVSTCAPVIID
jgi:hypothetical protein